MNRLYLIFAMALLAPATHVLSQVESSDALGPVSIESGVAMLQSSNTLIQFVGTHTGDDPNPRVGVFKKFEGALRATGDSVESIEVDIKTGSLATQIEKLTNHLKSPDFFDVREHPTAKFLTTEIEKAERGEHTVTGKLTLMGKTQEVSFPAKFDFVDGGVTMKGNVELDRTKFGMDRMTGRVEKVVSLKIVIGLPSELSPAAGGH